MSLQQFVAVLNGIVSESVVYDDLIHTFQTGQVCSGQIIGRHLIFGA